MCRLAVIGALMLATTAVAKPIEYETSWKTPEGTRVPVHFKGDLTRTVLTGVLTVDGRVLDLDGSITRSGDVFVAVRDRTGATVATFDGQAGEGKRIDGWLTRGTEQTFLSFVAPVSVGR
jgi:hypothetical protein